MRSIADRLTGCMKKNLLISLVLVSLTLSPLFAQTPPPEGKPSPECKAMHEKMMEGRKARDAKLEKMLATLKTATGQKKVDVMSDILTELLTERKEMQAHMQQMMEMRKNGKGCEMMGPGHPGMMDHRPGPGPDRPAPDHSEHH
mgnify:CR=1 FL=1